VISSTEFLVLCGRVGRIGNLRICTRRAIIGAGMVEDIEGSVANSEEDPIWHSEEGRKEGV